LRNDLIDRPDGVQDLLELAPIPGEVLGTANWRKLVGKKIMHDIDRQRRQEILKAAELQPSKYRRTVLMFWASLIAASPYYIPGQTNGCAASAPVLTMR